MPRSELSAQPFMLGLFVAFVLTGSSDALFIRVHKVRATKEIPDTMLFGTVPTGKTFGLITSIWQKDDLDVFVFVGYTGCLLVRTKLPYWRTKHRHEISVSPRAPHAKQCRAMGMDRMKSVGQMTRDQVCMTIKSESAVDA